MNSKIKVFIKVIFYFSAFTLGMFLAIFLPNRLVYKYTMDTIVDSLNAKNYKGAMIYMGGYYNSDYVYQKDFDEKSGIVLFESVTLRENKEGNNKYRLEYAYSGFIYNVKDSYIVKKAKDQNKSKIMLTDSNGKTQDITLLDYDSDGDKLYDSNNTLDDRGFIYLNFQNIELKNLAKIDFIDCEGNVFKALDLSEVNYKFNFEGKFFTDVTKFMVKYNEDNNATEALTKLDEEFRALSSKYIYSTYKDSSGSKATTVAILIIVFYFVGVYLIGDLGLGKRYTYRGIKFLICKIFKIKPKERKPKENEIVNDYQTLVTITLDISRLKEPELFQDEVNISYNSEYAVIDFKLSKENGYKESKKVRNGDYTNFKSDLNSNYDFLTFSSNVKIVGFKSNIMLVVKDKEGGSSNE